MRVTFREVPGVESYQLHVLLAVAGQDSAWVEWATVTHSGAVVWLPREMEVVLGISCITPTAIIRKPWGEVKGGQQ